MLSLEQGRLLVDLQLLELLRCPESRLALHVLSAEKLQKLNAEIQAGNVKNHSGKVLSEALQEVLVSSDGNKGYPVVEGIPVLLIDESFDIASI